MGSRPVAPRAIWVALGLLFILLAVGCGDAAVAPVTPAVETATPAPDTPSPTGTAKPLPTDSPLPAASATARRATATARPVTATRTASPATATTAPSPGSSATPPGPPATTAAVAATVSVGGATFSVELAVTNDEQHQGLSDRPSLDRGAGMLFVYDSPRTRAFWMKNMHFPLDILWIGADCTLVDFSRDVPPPAPGTKNSDLERYRPSAEIQYVLEVNAGAAADMQVGNTVEFGGAIAGEYGC